MFVYTTSCYTSAWRTASNRSIYYASPQSVVSECAVKEAVHFFTQETTIRTDYTNESRLDQLTVAQLDRISAPFETKSSLLCSQKRITIFGPENRVYLLT